MPVATKRAERLARAITWAESRHRSDNVARDRSYVYWHENFDRARAIIEADNLLRQYEKLGRPLHGCTEDAEADLEIYGRECNAGSHEDAMNAVLGFDDYSDEEE